MERDQNLEAIAGQLFAILAPRRLSEFSREIIVSKDIGGDVAVSSSTVSLNSFYFTHGDPIARVEHAIDLCIDYDRRLEQAILREHSSARHRLRCALRDLRRLGLSDDIQAIVEEELGVGSESELTLR